MDICNLLEYFPLNDIIYLVLIKRLNMMLV